MILSVLLVPDAVAGVLHPGDRDPLRVARALHLRRGVRRPGGLRGAALDHPARPLPHRPRPRHSLLLDRRLQTL